MSRARRLLREQKSTILLAGCTLLPLLTWWFATIPGFYSPDSMAVVEQVRSGNWSNVHTTAYTAWVYVTSLGGRAWSLVTLSQVVLIGAALVTLGSRIVRRGVPVVAVASSLGLLTILPHIGGLTVSVWKDVPYVAGALFTAAALLKLSESRQHNRAGWVLVFTGLLFLATHRWNGPLTVLLLSAGGAMMWRHRGIRFITIGIAAAAIGTASLVLPARLGLVDSGNWLLLNSARLHDIAVTVARDPDFARTSEAPLARVMPIAEWIDGGKDCTTHDTLLFEHLSADVDNRVDRVIARRDELASLWWSTVAERPNYVALARLCRGAGAWWPFPVVTRLPNSLWPLDASDPNLRWARYSPPLTTAAIRAAELTNWNHAVHWSLTRPLVSLSVLGGVLWMLRRRHRLREFTVVWPLVAAVIVSAGLTAVAHDPRYVAGANIVVQVVGMSLLGEVVAQRLRRKRAELV
jgi:hypothetical protein